LNLKFFVISLNLKISNIKNIVKFIVSSVVFVVKNLKLAKTHQLNLISNFYYKSRCCVQYKL
ncbi:hypothetical protein, partial [Campylobacter concisus]|uniref:hypothetical protein n=1 Tax=Campylobacter concisus TaxID=199 RepID=UPI001CA504A4